MLEDARLNVNIQGREIWYGNVGIAELMLNMIKD